MGDNKHISYVVRLTIMYTAAIAILIGAALTSFWNYSIEPNWSKVRHEVVAIDESNMQVLKDVDIRSICLKLNALEISNNLPQRTVKLKN
jgi:hypothetical protein